MKKYDIEAEKILGKKRWAKEELDRSIPKEQSDKIWKAAHDRLEGYLEKYADIPKGEHAHTDSRIFPMAAIYLSIKEATDEKFAFDFMERFFAYRCEGLAKTLARLMKVPGMKDLFVSIWDPMTMKMFGPSSGFSNRFYDNPKGEYRMDVTSCPYNRYLTELGCPEITKLFCTNDDLMYGNLPGIDFIRTQTIGRGGDCCDFYMRKSLKTDYKNWIPKGMIAGLAAGTAVLTGTNIAVWKHVKLSDRKADIAIKVLLGAGLAACAKATEWSIMAYREFSYNGKRNLSRGIIEGTADHVKIPAGGIGLDVGCGSGALTIACAKRNPDAEMVGLDRWGAEYASFSKRLCERNAEAEGVTNISFCKGDAVKLDYPDECFDAVTSNYVYHNIAGVNKQDLLRETLRVLKKGGTFAIHDIMSKARYGDMEKFVDELRNQGYEEVNLIHTDNGLFMSKSEARRMMLTGSALLVGRK
ncbi:MAG: L-2-amino-thiazoline-4-carboxylic acid hydrolase [Mogibacterium sp.]|nr:L-2-amino-thiazoline-4-carboxylic acid hydrolase [Mogibacterium sp.]